MRDTFVRVLSDIAKDDRNTLLITGDLGFGVLKNYWETYPDQFINAGVAEQNMTGLAAGLALEGKTVFTYSIANFPTLRCLEQIRNDAAYHNANVKIVAVGGGLCYGALGMSHHATEDIAILRALPEVAVFAPGDPVETEAVVRAAYDHQGTCYLRLGRGGEKRIHQKSIEFVMGQAIKIQDGEQVVILSTGGILEEAKLAADELNRTGIETGLYSFPSVKPIDRETIINLAKRINLIVTVEEHNITGGFGSAVSEILAELEQPRARQVKVGLEDQYASVVGNQEYLRHVYKIDKEGIVNKVEQFLNMQLA